MADTVWGWTAVGNAGRLSARMCAVWLLHAGGTMGMLAVLCADVLLQKEKLRQEERDEEEFDQEVET